MLLCINTGRLFTFALMTKKPIPHCALIPSLIFLSFFFWLTACNSTETFKKAEDAQDAGREFIRASLDGNYEKARFYLYDDTTNKMMFAKWKKDYDRMNPEEQQKFKDASILPIDIHPLND